MSSTLSLNNIQADLFRYHILPFIRHPTTTFINLWGINSQIRRNLKEVILPVWDGFIAHHANKQAEIEGELTFDNLPGLTYNLCWTADAVCDIDFRILNYEDENTLFVLSVFYEFLMLTEEFPTREDVKKLLNIENAVQNLSHVDPSDVSKNILNAVLKLTDTLEWRKAEERFSEGPEFNIIKWIKLFKIYLQWDFRMKSRIEMEEFHYRAKKHFKKMRKHIKKIWVE